MKKSDHSELAQYFEPVEVGPRCLTPGCAWPGLQEFQGYCRHCAFDRVRRESPSRSTAATLVDELGSGRRSGHGRPPMEYG
jgi:hypothetical protein